MVRRFPGGEQAWSVRMLVREVKERAEVAELAEHPFMLQVYPLPTDARLAPSILGTVPWDNKLTKYYLATPTDSPSLHPHWIDKEEIQRATRDNSTHVKTIRSCNFNLPLDEFEIIRNQAQHNSRVPLMKPCDHCFKRIKVPETWETPDTVTILDDHEDSADPEDYDDTDNELATDTEDYVYKPTLPAPAAPDTAPQLTLAPMLLDSQGQTTNTSNEIPM